MLPDALMRRELAILALALAPVPDVEQQAALILGDGGHAPARAPSPRHGAPAAPPAGTAAPSPGTAGTAAPGTAGTTRTPA